MTHEVTDPQKYKQVQKVEIKAIESDKDVFKGSLIVHLGNGVISQRNGVIYNKPLEDRFGFILKAIQQL
jgi:hypothetical protein